MTRKIKDTKAPKRPLTSFLLFSNYIRETEPEIKKLPIQEQAAKMGEKWREASPELKKRFGDESANNKLIYLDEKKKYELTDEYKEMQKKIKEEKKEGKDGKKKRVVKMSGYRLFISELTDKSDDENDAELVGKSYMAKSGIKWSRLSEEKKDEYNQRAAKMAEETKEEGSGNE